MKVLAIMFAAVIAVGVAIPQPNGEVPRVVNEVPAPSSEEYVAKDIGKNLVADAITGLIQRLSQALQDMGFDPMNITSVAFDYALPVPSLFGVDVKGQDFVLGGISNIVVNQLSYGLLTSRLTFNISLPQVELDVGNTDLVVRALSQNFATKYSGKITIKDVGVAGTARATLGITSGIVNLRDLDLNFFLGGINSQLKEFRVLGADMTDFLSTFFDESLFNAIKSHEADISELMEIIVWSFFD